MRFALHEVGMIKSSPNALLAEGTGLDGRRCLGFCTVLRARHDTRAHRLDQPPHVRQRNAVPPHDQMGDAVVQQVLQRRLDACSLVFLLHARLRQRWRAARERAIAEQTRPEHCLAGVKGSR